MSKLCYIPLLIILFSHFAMANDSEFDCNYTTWVWDTINKKSINHIQVKKSKNELLPTEKDPHSKCTVCSEDQVMIKIEGLPPVQVCKHYAEKVEWALRYSMEKGFPIYDLIGYRVGKSKGPVDEKGLRTQFSNHSFGTAIDINSKFNGLYNNCVRFSEQCRLTRGGPWNPTNSKSITKESPPYDAFKKIGWGWGGELQGRQKDFMHFSLSGD